MVPQCREILAWRTSKQDVAWNIRHIDGPNVPLNDMPSEIAPVRLNCPMLIIVCPDNLNTLSHLGSQVHASTASEQGNRSVHVPGHEHLSSRLPSGGRSNWEGKECHN
jgi:hypothetical protein